jgi:hypothetical protein
MSEASEAIGALVGGLCACICVCACVGGGVTAFVFTCIFLDKDKDKGGSDPTCLDAGDAIWVYVIVRLILGWVGGVCSGSSKQESEVSLDNTISVNVYCSIVTTLICVIYGGVVLFSEDVCDQYKNTGLYKMYYVMYWIDVSILSISVLTLVIGFLAAACGGPQPAEVEQNIRNSIRRGSANLGLDIAPAQATAIPEETLASADTERRKSVDEAVKAEAIDLTEKSVPDTNRRLSAPP